MSRTHGHARIGSPSHCLRPTRGLPGRRWASLDNGCQPTVALFPFFWMTSCSTTCIVAIFLGVASTWDCAAPSTDSVTDPRLDRYTPSPRESQGHTSQHTLRARSRDLNAQLADGACTHPDAKKTRSKETPRGPAFPRVYVRFLSTQCYGPRLLPRLP